MDRRRKGESGLSLIELLVVLGIVGIISAVSIPLLARAGLFTSSKADLAARELFNVLRTAKIYATTHNVETAVAYGGLLVQDSFLTGQDGQPLTVPVVDSVALVRRLDRDELLLHGLSANDVMFVPLSARAGEFKTFPSGTCILPDVFAFNEVENFSTTGLTDIIVFEPIDGQFLAPRTWYPVDDINKVNPSILSYALSSNPNAFPAHRFSPEGALLPDQRLPQQRVKVRVGLLPSADPSDRFFVDLGDVRLMDARNIHPVPILFSDLPVEPDFVDTLHDPDRPDTNVKDTPIDIDVEILLYVATGRVKVAS